MSYYITEFTLARTHEIKNLFIEIAWILFKSWSFMFTIDGGTICSSQFLNKDKKPLWKILWKKNKVEFLFCYQPSNEIRKSYAFYIDNSVNWRRRFHCNSIGKFIVLRFNLISSSISAYSVILIVLQRLIDTG